ncbi:unnamed protein product, partial [Prunus brigantina]
GGAPARCSESDGRMIYGVNETITGMVLWRLEKSRVGQSRLKRSAWWFEKICMVESDRGKWVVKSAFGIVKHGGRQNALTKRGRFSSRVDARAERKSLRSVYDRDLLGTNIAPTSLDSSVVAWVEAEWIPRDGPFAFLLK